jgi:hypothetical protein
VRTYWVGPAAVLWVGLIGLVFGQWWRWNAVQPDFCLADCPPPPPYPFGQPALNWVLVAATVGFGVALGGQRRLTAALVLPLIGGILPAVPLPLLSTVHHPAGHLVLVLVIAAVAVFLGYLLLLAGWFAGRLLIGRRTGAGRAG